MITLNETGTHLIETTDEGYDRHVPIDPNNGHYRELQKRLEGWTETLEDGSEIWHEATETLMPFQSSAEQVISSLSAAIQQHLDAWAQTRGYDGILSACTYATSKVPRFKTEGQAAVNARDEVWSAAYTLLEEVQSGAKPMPTMDEVIATLPVLSWPA